MIKIYAMFKNRRSGEKGEQEQDKMKVKTFSLEDNGFSD